MMDIGNKYPNFNKYNNDNLYNLIAMYTICGGPFTSQLWAYMNVVICFVSVAFYEAAMHADVMEHYMKAAAVNDALFASVQRK